MAQSIHKTEQPVVLEGYQAVLKPGKFGYKLSALVDQNIIDSLEDERTEVLKWAESKLKNPKRSILKPEPWEEVKDGVYQVRFSWKDETRPAVVDTEGTLITNEDTPLFSGSKVKLAFKQRPYILPDKTTYGTKLVLVGVQVIALNSSAGVDTGDLNDVDVAELFGKTSGFKTAEPNVTAAEITTEEDDF